MYKLDYGTQLSPSPIKLSIGSLRKPTLKDVADISFNEFNFFEVLMTMNPETFYTKLNGEKGKQYWDSLSDEEKYAMTIFDVIENNEDLADSFSIMLNFFFVESVVFNGGNFILLSDKLKSISEIKEDSDVHGAITKDSFDDVISIIKQICCISIDSDDSGEKKFKNAMARKMYEKMQKAAKKKSKKSDNINYTLPNIISSVANKHPALNPTNVWDLTIFQLMDSFNRLQSNSIYEIESTRVSVWGDEKNTFDAALWHKNTFDKNNV